MGLASSTGLDYPAAWTRVGRPLCVSPGASPGAFAGDRRCLGFPIPSPSAASLTACTEELPSADGRRWVDAPGLRGPSRLGGSATPRRGGFGFRPSRLCPRFSTTGRTLGAAGSFRRGPVGRSPIVPAGFEPASRGPKPRRMSCTPRDCRQSRSIRPRAIIVSLNRLASTLPRGLARGKPPYGTPI